MGAQLYPQGPVGSDRCAIFDALAEQTLTVPGSQASESVVPRHAARIKALKAERAEIEAEAEE